MKPITNSFSNNNKFSITHYLTLFCLFFTLFCPDKAQNIISAIGILSFGILHGANDIKILVKKNSTSKPLLKLLYLISYIVVVFLGVSIFFFFPALGLMTFIVVSCYHFGEQHWQSKLIRIREKRLFFFTYGTLIFSILFIFHYPAINKIIFQIS
ncbi:MAG: Brp/Blh family beta-carotene 15,15'-dioxygenase, partial [Flavobacteriaceae bacterium]